MLQGKAILVVDDEPDLREILCDEFQLEGAEVNNAPNGQEALKKVEANPPDIVVSDLRMPGGDGVTLAKELKNRNALSPLVVLMTGFADLTAEEAYEIGAEGFMTKPFHLESVRENLSRLLMPSRERWAQTPFKAPVKAVAESADIFRAHPASSYLARGGMFWPGERLPVRVGEEVSFDAGHNLKGTAVVRWVRSSGQNGRGPGMGLEFLSLAPESLIWVEDQINNLKPVAFLPRGF